MYPLKYTFCNDVKLPFIEIKYLRIDRIKFVKMRQTGLKMEKKLFYCCIELKKKMFIYFLN